MTLFVPRECDILPWSGGGAKFDPPLAAELHDTNMVQCPATGLILTLVYTSDGFLCWFWPACPSLDVSTQ